jgi:hypothetical protein
MRQPIHRRAFLRGTGAGAAVTIGLPFLEAMLPRSYSGQAAAATAGANPVKGAVNRFVLLYTPNGVNRATWNPKTEGATYETTQALKALEPHRKDFTLIGGLAVPMALMDRGGDHAKAMGCYLTGVRINATQGNDIKAGITADQVLANAIGKATRFPSLEIGLDYGRQEGGCDPGYACVYTNNLSWRGEKTPSSKEVNPRNLFDRLFGSAQGAGDLAAAEFDEQQEFYDRSILDYAKTGLGRLNQRIGRDDRHRMDEYLTAIREIEQRLDAPPSDLKLPPGTMRPTRIPDTYKDHFRLMADLQILALQQDQTRISTFMLGVEQSRRVYPEIGIPEEHHGLTHHAGNPEKIAKVAVIDAYIIEQFAYYLEKMKSIKEGDKTLLDNSMVLFGNGNGEAAEHDHIDCATILAGGGAGTLKKGGTYTRYEDGTPVSNLWLAMMDRMGHRMERFGDSTGHLAI